MHARIQDRSFPNPARLRPEAQFGLLAAVQVALVFSITAISVPLPVIAADLDLSAHQVILVAVAYGAPFGGFLLIAGRVVDATGARRALRVALLLFATASAGAALARVPEVLLLARAGQGMAAAFVAPAALALAGRLFEEPRRQRAMATWGTLSSAGAAAGLALSGVIVSWLSWRAVLAMPVLVAAVVLTGSRWFDPGPRPIPRRIHAPGGVLGAIGLASASAGLTASIEQPWTSAHVHLPTVLGGLGLIGFAVIERRAADPLVPRYVLASRNWRRAATTLLITSSAMATTGFYLSLELQDVRGYGASDASLALLPLALVATVGPRAARLIDRFGAPRIAQLGLALTAIGLFVLSQMDVASSYWGHAFAGLVIVAVGAGIAFSAGTVSALEHVDPGDDGAAGAIVNAAIELGPVVGLALIPTVASLHSGIADQHGTSAITSGASAALLAGALATAAVAIAPAVGSRLRRTDLDDRIP